MIVLSLILVIIAALTLLFGFFSDGLELIWISIGACVLSIITLAVGVMQRRRAQPEPTPPGVGYGPGAVGPKPAPAQLMDLERATAPPEVVAKTPAREVAEQRADIEAAADAAADEVVVVPATSAAEATRRRAAKKTATRKKAAAKKAPAKKAAKKSTRKKAATKKAATKKAAKKSTRKKSATKKATGATTGAAARDALRSIKGVGPAKQDALLKQFKSIEAIKAASVDEIAALDGLGPTAAKKIKDSL